MLCHAWSDVLLPRDFGYCFSSDDAVAPPRAHQERGVGGTVQAALFAIHVQAKEAKIALQRQVGRARPVVE